MSYSEQPTDQTDMMVEKGNKLVLEQVVTTIASVADTAEEKFQSYYDRLVLQKVQIICMAVHDYST